MVLTGGMSDVHEYDEWISGVDELTRMISGVHKQDQWC